MEICTVDEYNAPADHRAIIANVRTSALAAGWTVEEYRAANEVWQESVGWTVGSYPQQADVYSGSGYNGCYLQLQSNGFGNQGAKNRWNMYGFRTDTYNTNMHVYSGSRSGELGPTDVVSYGWPSVQNYPVTRYGPHIGSNVSSTLMNRWPTTMDGVVINSYYDTAIINANSTKKNLTIPTTGAIKQWVICNGTKFIHNIVNVDNVYMDHAIFGVFDLFDPTISDGVFYTKSVNGYYCGYWGYKCHPHYSLYSTGAIGLLTESFINGAYSWLATEGSVSPSSVSSDCSIVSPYYNPAYGDYYNSIVLQNTWSGKRVIHVPTVKARLSGTLCPVGRTWYGILNTENLLPGQILTYGSEQYQVWPVYLTSMPGTYNYPTNTYGLAYRIA